ncbi:phospho-N-acetylmuramoyl-pentapeptide-transferase [Motilibacter rhizosphaerae]|uniref:Phospho-N-acetylmuramoyl-pentapeptide-transferase n=1 Tax=Motilibacter rhizosphaerae TaxID=598652 RepID=A0A4Q7NG99_9ACTN|nr:phospho-N-acetylmuramoyl-pentapeptide-transferase [Motilibacter rhizosphaerae]RZS82921.1 phospho-N-acetylmuramoyl-pentapeptide-transferase [Motilibacter rhizosphaerae]
MISILVAGAVALLVGLFGTPVLIGVLRRHGYAQAIRDVNEGYPDHDSKRGTPSMGGAVIICAVLLGYVVAHLVAELVLHSHRSHPTLSGALVLGLMTGLGFVGFLDDYIKIFKQRSLGLRARTKFAGQSLTALAFGVLALHFEDTHGLTPASEHISFIRDTALVLGPVVTVVWIYLMVAASSNGVNLTDGLDGLATGASVMTFGSYVLIGVWQFGNRCTGGQVEKCYLVRDPLDLAIIASALVGACFGFLWWNASPAKIFMGDTGSLALGGALAGLAVLTRTELLLVLLGGLFVVITLSVVIQVGWFKLSGGKRVFRMAPLQHHFELAGWGEVTIVIRFWIIAGLFVAIGLGVFYAEWVRST